MLRPSHQVGRLSCAAAGAHGLLSMSKLPDMINNTSFSLSSLNKAVTVTLPGLDVLLLVNHTKAVHLESAHQEGLYHSADHVQQL